MPACAELNARNARFLNLKEVASACTCPRSPRYLHDAGTAASCQGSRLGASLRLLVASVPRQRIALYLISNQLHLRLLDWRMPPMIFAPVIQATSFTNETPRARQMFPLERSKLLAAAEAASGRP